MAAAALRAMEIAREEPWRRERLRENAARLRARLAALGCAPAGAAESPIVPVMVGDAARAVALGERLLAAGFVVGAIRPPTVPPGGSRLRLSVSAVHTAEQIDGLADALGAEPLTLS
jgi:8-amino-7-oxononanoate synthase